MKKIIYDAKTKTQTIAEMTQEEIADYEKKMEEERQKQEAQEKHRQLEQDEVFVVFAKQNINSLSVDDATSLKMKQYHPTFDEIIGQTVKQGFKFLYGDDLYKTRQQEMTIDAQYPPSIHTAALYEIINEQYDGTEYDPIPYKSNMELEKGKYYTQYNVLYICTSGTGQAVYDDLKDLIHIFVEEVE